MSVGTLFLGGRYRSELDNGLPNVGGQLWSYASGTSTFLATYTDATLTTPNPYESDGYGGLFLRLDSRGEFQVWMGNSPYRFTEKTSSGTVISTTDGVQSVAGQIATAIAAAVSGLPSVVNLPPGAIIPYGGGSVPSGFLLCNGAEVSRTAYAALFAAIGTLWGIGNGSTTFNLPPPGHGFIGAGGTLTTIGNTVGSIGGEELHALTIAEMPSHQHVGSTATDSGHTHQFHNPSGGSDPPQCNANMNTANVNAATGTGYADIVLAIAPQGGDTPFSLLQPSMVVTALIKT